MQLDSWKVKIPALVVFTILSATASAAQENEPVGWNERVACARANYSKFSCELSAIVEPLEIDKVTSYFDGGTIDFRLKGDDSKSYYIRLKVSENANLARQFPSVFAARYYESSLIVSETGFDKRSVLTTIPVRSLQEAELYGALLRWEKSLAYPIDSEDASYQERLMHRVIEAMDIRFAYCKGAEVVERYDMTWHDLEDEVQKGEDEKVGPNPRKALPASE